MKNEELLKSMPVSQPVSAESLLITMTKSNGKYKQRFQPLTQNYRDNSWTQSLNSWKNPLTGQTQITKKHSKNNYSDNTMKTIAYIISTYHIGTYDLDIRDVLKSYIIARYYGWEPKEEDLEEIISHTSYFNINVDDAIYEVLTMPREKITI